MAESRQNFSGEYKKFIKKESRISRTIISPNNVYRISTYKYSDGQTRSLRGLDETLIFVTGVYKKTIYGLKLSKLRPNIFFEWTKKIVKEKDILNEDTNLISFSQLSPPFDMTGDRFYRTYIKDSGLLKKPQIPFRSYKMEGIRYVSEVYFKKEILESYYA
jgi:hypothetical protein